MKATNYCMALGGAGQQRQQGYCASWHCSKLELSKHGAHASIQCRSQRHGEARNSSQRPAGSWQLGGNNLTDTASALSQCFFQKQVQTRKQTTHENLGVAMHGFRYGYSPTWQRALVWRQSNAPWGETLSTVWPELRLSCCD